MTGGGAGRAAARVTARRAIAGAPLASLGALLNHHVFAYRGSPLRGLTVSVSRGRLYQHGKLRGIGFTIESEASLTPAGEIRLHPTSIKVAGLSVGGLLELFGLELQKLVNLEGARGVRLEGNDFVLSPTGLLPPPAIRGRVGAIEVLDTAIVQVFVPPGEARAKPLRPPDTSAANYMYFRGGTLRFGKLTMRDADLEIVGADPRDPFDFFLDRYNLQLVGGYSKNTPEHGLVVTMPDFLRARALLRRGGLRPGPGSR